MADEIISTAEDHDDRGDRSDRQVVAALILLHAERFLEVPSAVLLSDDKITVGREHAGLLLPDDSVSRSHALIERTGGATSFTVHDRESKNGVLVGRTRISSPTPITNGDIVSFGNVVFRFLVGPRSMVMDFGRYRIDGHVAGGRRAPKVTELVGGCLIDRVCFEIERIAPTELSCVLRGESGTGKELVARAIHRLSGKKGELVAINCAALPATLVESELFGYRRGAFSGADRDRAGLIRQAHEGTLFLDEIGDMPPDMQAKLLRVLESREVRPLGSSAAEPVDVRVVAASHVDLKEAVAQGKFRGDLLARLAEHTLLLPPLRDRREDMYLLTRTFLDAEGRSDVQFTPAAMRALILHDFPWNVRELRSVVKRALAFIEGKTIDEAALPEDIRGNARSSSTPAAVQEPLNEKRPSKQQLESLLAQNDGNVAALARAFDREPAQIRRWLKRYNLDADAYRKK
jgi:sigma-54 dependent transcriptional regulator, acetoin dehydrogenase operon transcriptional activator AcoR